MNSREPMSLILKGGRTNDVPHAASVSPTSANRENTHLGQLFESVAFNNLTKLAFTAKSVGWTYFDLLLASRAISQSLLKLHAFQTGDRVLLMLPNSAEYIAAFYGILLAGGVVVPIPPKTEAGYLQSIVHSTEACAIITDPTIANQRKDQPFHHQIEVDLSVLTHEDTLSSALTTGSELAAIFFTGGSTGTPKGVMLSHRNLISNARSIRQYLQITPADRPLCVLPFHHAFGNSVWQSHLLAGAHLVCDGLTSFPETMVAALARHECTSLSGVPDLFRVLLERSSLGQASLPHLRYMAVAGGALPRHLSLEISRRIAPAEFYVMYGQTEATARLAYLRPNELEQMPEGCIGQAVPGVTLEIVDENGRPTLAGQIGELRASGDNVMLGYWRDASATADRIRSGWLHTGDLASLDNAGRVTIHGRNSGFVKIAGYRVQPADLEDFAVRRLTATQAVAVAYECPTIGTRLALFVRFDQSKSNPNVSEMIARSRAELPRHMVPELIQLVDEFPLNSAMKIDRPLLQRWADQAKAGSARALA
ncbi:class I adenylate-forming enzyme family protein [Schlesneria paludicola]|uniref:class I adenylate-forming enzyme family protein n=1 Tax=Schlesneria paludicola TaxID=360056 RepID=UPI0012F7817C|nr:class I adenylate-forming enzyme family protein [Schlesneria paludicola]